MTTVAGPSARIESASSRASLGDRWAAEKKRYRRAGSTLANRTRPSCPRSRMTGSHWPGESAPVGSQDRYRGCHGPAGIARDSPSRRHRVAVGDRRPDRCRETPVRRRCCRHKPSRWPLPAFCSGMHRPLPVVGNRAGTGRAGHDQRSPDRRCEPQPGGKHRHVECVATGVLDVPVQVNIHSVVADRDQAGHAQYSVFHM